MIALESHNLTVSYNSKPVLWNIDFEINEGEITGVLGPNGSGKSTLLKTIMGLKEPDSGFVRLFENKLSEIRDKISYVPQRESLDWNFPASVFDVVLMGRYNPSNIFQRSSKEDKDIASEALEKVNLLNLINRPISQLSGGQQQRVLLARSLAQNADMYLMDEPFAGVDAATESAILSILNEMKNQGKTIVMVHHDLQTAKEFFENIILLNTRLIGFGKTIKILNPSLLQQAYGGKHTILDKLNQEIQQQGYKVREQGEEKH